MGHAAARQYDRVEPHRADDAGQGLTQGPAALHWRLRWQIGIDIDRQNRIGDLEMGQWDAERVIDLGGAGEGRVETLRVHLAHDLEPDRARHAPMKSAASEVTLCLVADMDREGRCGSVEELLDMVVGEDDP